MSSIQVIYNYNESTAGDDASIGRCVKAAYNNIKLLYYSYRYIIAIANTIYNHNVLTVILLHANLLITWKLKEWEIIDRD